MKYIALLSSGPKETDHATLVGMKSKKQFRDYIKKNKKVKMAFLLDAKSDKVSEIFNA